MFAFETKQPFCGYYAGQSVLAGQSV